VFDDLDTSDISEIVKEDTRQSSSNYGKKDFSKFQRKPDVLDEPYIPVCLYIDRDFPDEIKKNLIDIASKLISKKITVRYNADDKDIHAKLSGLSTKYTEAFIPWKNFNEIDSKHYFNTLTSKHIAETNFGAWDKIPDSVKGLLARNVRMLFGDKNNSIVMCLITWSKDGASKASEVNKDTGRSSFIIKVASLYGWPVINTAKDNSFNILERTFRL